MLGLGNSLVRGGVLGFSNTYSLDFDGTDDYVDVGTAYNGVKSISFLLKVDDVTSNTDYILGLNDTDYISVVDGTVTLSGFSGGTNTIYVDASEASTVDTAWHHILITSTTARNASNCDLGRTQSNNSYNMVGNLDEVAFTSDVKSASDFADGTTPLDISGLSNLQNWWRMGDGVLDDGNVTGNGLIADQVNPALGSDLASSLDWNNNGSDPYETLTTSGNSVTEADNTSGWGIASTDTFSLTTGIVYKLVFDFTLNSGAVPNKVLIAVNSDLGSLQKFIITGVENGLQTHYFTVDATRTDYRFGVRENSATNWSLSALSIKPVNGNPGLMTNMASEDIVKDTP